jgi:hypothetical protein
VTAFSQIADSTLTDGVIGFDPADELNRLLTAVQLTIAEDRTCSGLVCDILEVQNEIDATGRGSSLVEGAIQWDVVYRHALDDPRRFIGET